MYTAYFNQFAWEEEAKILDLPYFYLGKYRVPFCRTLNANLFLHLKPFLFWVLAVVYHS